MASFSSLKNEAFSREERKRQYRESVLGMTAFDRHKKFMNEFVQFYGSSSGAKETLPLKSDFDSLRESYRFIRSDEDDADNSWEQRLAKRYYNKLFKEYCIADMKRYKESKIGLRWRTEKEVIAGKGQFICGCKGCEERRGLHSYEVNFAYKEDGEEKQALVKLRLCPKHGYQLNYRKEKENERQQRKEENRRKRKRVKERQKLKDEDSESGGNNSESGEGSRDENDNCVQKGKSTVARDRENEGVEVPKPASIESNESNENNESISGARNRSAALEPQMHSLETEDDSFFRDMLL